MAAKCKIIACLFTALVVKFSQAESETIKIMEVKFSKDVFQKFYRFLCSGDSNVSIGKAYNEVDHTASNQVNTLVQYHCRTTTHAINCSRYFHFVNTSENNKSRAHVSENTISCNACVEIYWEGNGAFVADPYGSGVVKYDKAGCPISTTTTTVLTNTMSNSDITNVTSSITTSQPMNTSTVAGGYTKLAIAGASTFFILTVIVAFAAITYWKAKTMSFNFPGLNSSANITGTGSQNTDSLGLTCQEEISANDDMIPSSFSGYRESVNPYARLNHKPFDYRVSTYPYANFIQGSMMQNEVCNNVIDSPAQSNSNDISNGHSDNYVNSYTTEEGEENYLDSAAAYWSQIANTEDYAVPLGVPLGLALGQMNDDIYVQLEDERSSTRKGANGSVGNTSEEGYYTSAESPPCCDMNNEDLYTVPQCNNFFQPMIPCETENGYANVNIYQVD